MKNWNGYGNPKEIDQHTNQPYSYLATKNLMTTFPIRYKDYKQLEEMEKELRTFQKIKSPISVTETVVKPLELFNRKVPGVFSQAICWSTSNFLFNLTSKRSS